MRILVFLLTGDNTLRNITPVISVPSLCDRWGFFIGNSSSIKMIRESRIKCETKWEPNFPYPVEYTGIITKTRMEITMKKTLKLTTAAIALMAALGGLPAMAQNASPMPAGTTAPKSAAGVDVGTLIGRNVTNSKGETIGE